MSSFSRNIGAVMLIAGTAIGSGMLALPIALAKLGILQSIILMFLVAIFTYYSALINLELNLQVKSHKALSLGGLSRHFSGRFVEMIGSLSVKILSFALLSVFIYGGASVFGRLIYNLSGNEFNFENIALIYSVGSILILTIPIKMIDYFNRILFILLLVAIGVIVFTLSSILSSNNIPEMNMILNINHWSAVLPIIFTSFGFQGSIPAIIDYCGKDAKSLKRVFFVGSFLPAVIYLFWTITILLIMYQYNNDFYFEMLENEVEVSDLIEELVSISSWKTTRLICWCISVLAILTSVTGVGIGLILSFKSQFGDLSKKKNVNQFIYAIIAILPSYFIAIQIPNAFIMVLGFAGMILSIIAILLPLFLLEKIRDSKKLYYTELKGYFIPFVMLIFGLSIVAAELFNIYMG